MNELKNCAECGGLFSSSGSSFCQSCTVKLRRDLTKIEVFLKHNPNSDLKDIATGTGVSEKTVQRFINEGTLMPNKSSIKYSKCIVCGAKIYEGKLCTSCRKKVSK